MVTAHLRDLVEPDTPLAARNADQDRGDVFRRLEATVGARHHVESFRGNLASGDIEVLARQGGSDVLQRQAIETQPLLVHDHLELAHQPARRLHAGDAVQRQQLGHQAMLNPVAHLARAARSGTEPGLVDRVPRGIELVQPGRVDVLRQLGPRQLQQARGVLQGKVQVDAVLELQVDVGATLGGTAMDAGEILGAGEIALQHPRDLLLHHFRRDAGIIHRDPDQRVNHLRQQVHGQALDEKQAEHQHHRGDREGADRAADGGMRQPGVVAIATGRAGEFRPRAHPTQPTMRTRAPSLRSRGLVATTRSPGARPSSTSCQAPRVMPGRTLRLSRRSSELITMT